MPKKNTSSTANAKWLRKYIAEEPDFPTAGITFYWYGPLLRNPKAFDKVIQEFVKHYQDMDIDIIMGIEARGFLFCSTLAHALGVPFGLIRKPGKLPGKVVSEKFKKEYSRDALQMETIAIKKGDKVLLIDDLIATGGTVVTACKLAEKLGGKVIEIACMIDLPKLKDRVKIPCPIFSLLEL